MKPRRPILSSQFVLPQEDVNNIVERAFSEGVLFWISASNWGNRKKMTDELMAEFNLPKEAVRAVQSLVDHKEVKEVTKWSTRAHAEARSCELPWVVQQRGIHWIPKGKVNELIQKCEEYKQQQRENLEIFIEKYPQLKEEFKAKFPKFYKEQYYPSEQSLRYKFTINWGIALLTLPSEGKVQVLSKEVMEQEDKKFRSRMEESILPAINMIRGSFLKIINHLKEVCSDPNKKLYDSAVEKPKQFLDEFFKNMNIFGDKPFEKVAKYAADLLEGIDTEDLRDDETYRQSLGKALDGVVKSFQMLPTVRLQRSFDL